MYKGPTGREHEWHHSESEVQQKGWGRDVSYILSTQSLELFPVYSGTQSVFIRKKEKAHLEA